VGHETVKKERQIAGVVKAESWVKHRIGWGEMRHSIGQRESSPSRWGKRTPSEDSCLDHVVALIETSRVWQEREQTWIDRFLPTSEHCDTLDPSFAIVMNLIVGSSMSKGLLDQRAICRN
jgi:hypothetical protein